LDRGSISIIGCTISALALLILCGGVGLALYIGVQTAGDALKASFTAAKAARQAGSFCSYVELQDYSTVYDMLSTVKQGSTSQSDFARHAAVLDASAGAVVTCTIDPNQPQPTISGDGKRATVRVQVARGDNANLAHGTMKLILENDEWKIDSADSSLKLF
jgi:hypothetical protein